MNSLQNIDINAINAISSAVTVMQRTNRPFNAEENRNLIDELTLNCPALDLEDLDSMIDWEDASDDLKVFKLILEGEKVDWVTMAIGSSLSFLLAITSIHYFLKILDKLGMMPFVIYRLVLGVGLLWFVW